MLLKLSLILDLIWLTTASGIYNYHHPGTQTELLRNLTRLLYPAEDDDDKDKEDATKKEEVETELEKQLEELYIVFGLRCLSVLRYLTDHTGVLSLGVLAR